VISVSECDGSFLAVLDKTIFFPEGGGQPCDTGYIDDARVAYVFEKEGIIYHRIDKLIPEKKVLAKLDYDRRLDHMQQHCGEHILSGVFLKLYGGRNKGFHMGEDYVTADIDLEDITEEMVNKAEERANIDIYKSKLVKTYVVDKEQADKLPLRKELKVDSDIRIVDIEGVDIVACCGTHPRLTSEVGIIKVLKTEKYKK
jgi:alanyl-tRNA synthetase